MLGGYNELQKRQHKVILQNWASKTSKETGFLLCGQSA